jgi:hypothetical protein
MSRIFLQHSIETNLRLTRTTGLQATPHVRATLRLFNRRNTLTLVRCIYTVYLFGL